MIICPIPVPILPALYHPYEKGYAKMAAKFCKELLKALEYPAEIGKAAYHIWDR